MISSINSTYVERKNDNNVTTGVIGKSECKNTAFSGIFSRKKNQETTQAGAPYALNINTSLRTEEEKLMYSELVRAVNSSSANDLSPFEQKFSQAQKLDVLLKNGKLLNTKSNNGTTTLSSLYRILNTPRINNLSNLKIANQVIDALFEPSVISQKIGDVPLEVKRHILNNNTIDPEIKQKPRLLDVEGGGTCVAASVEFCLADKHPAEFARWAEALTSPANSVRQTVNTSALSKNFLDSMELLETFKMKTTNFNFDVINLELKPDKDAITRAMIQNSYQDPGEHNIIDVLIQSTLMNVGSQKTYNSLTDKRKGDFSIEPQGLIEFEKTFVESIVNNEEKLSIVYQNLIEDENTAGANPESVNAILTGYRCGFDKIEKHIIDTLMSGENVIIGCIFTDENKKVQGGHEMTILGAKKAKDGETIFICNDTDDGKNEYVEYRAGELLPKIHHAGYPAHIVEHETELLYMDNIAA